MIIDFDRFHTCFRSTRLQKQEILTDLVLKMNCSGEKVAHWMKYIEINHYVRQERTLEKLPQSSYKVSCVILGKIMTAIY